MTSQVWKKSRHKAKDMSDDLMILGDSGWVPDDLIPSISDCGNHTVAVKRGAYAYS